MPVLLWVCAAVVSFLAKEINMPSSSRAGFYVGAFASQLHIPIAASTAAACYAVLPKHPNALDTCALLLALSAAAAILYDFIVGFHLHTPDPPLPFSPPPPSLRRRLVAAAKMACPLLWIIFDLSGVERVRNIVFATTPTGDLRLDVIGPKGWRKSLQKEEKVASSKNPAHKDKSFLRPVLLYIHGGGWIRGSKDYIGHFVINAVVEEGWLAVSTDYRLSSLKGATGATWPEHIVDVKQAIVWVKKNIEAYGGDPARVVLCGGSAGGHLAALAALTADVPSFQPGFEKEDTTVQGCIPIYGVHDFVDSKGQWVAWDRHHRRRHHDESKPAIIISFLQKFIIKNRFETHRHMFLEASPTYHAERVRGQHVPFLVVHGDRDILVPCVESKHFYDLLDPRKASLFVVRGGHHAFDSLPSPRGYAMTACMRKFLSMDCFHNQ